MSNHHDNRDHTHSHRGPSGRRNTLTLPPIRDVLGDVLTPSNGDRHGDASSSSSRRSSWHGRHHSVSPEPYTIPHPTRHAYGHHEYDRYAHASYDPNQTSPASSYESRPSLDRDAARPTSSSSSSTTSKFKSLHRLNPASFQPSKSPTSPGTSTSGSPYAYPPSSASPLSPSPHRTHPHPQRSSPPHLTVASPRRSQPPPSSYVYPGGPTNRTYPKLLPSTPQHHPHPYPSSSSPGSHAVSISIPPPSFPPRPTLQLSPPAPYPASYPGPSSSTSAYPPSSATSAYPPSSTTSAYPSSTTSQYSQYPPLGTSTSAGASASASYSPRGGGSFPFPPSSRETTPEGPPPIRIKLRRRKRGGGFKVGGNAAPRLITPNSYVDPAYATLLDLDTDEADYVNGPFRTVKIEVSGTKDGKLVYELDIPESMGVVAAAMGVVISLSLACHFFSLVDLNGSLDPASLSTSDLRSDSPRHGTPTGFVACIAIYRSRVGLYPTHPTRSLGVAFAFTSIYVFPYEWNACLIIWIISHYRMDLDLGYIPFLFLFLWFLVSGSWFPTPVSTSFISHPSLLILHVCMLTTFPSLPFPSLFPLISYISFPSRLIHIDIMTAYHIARSLLVQSPIANRQSPVR
ncbi:hypothetical protein M422DRAFT_774019 [Sphaerobolus stellatus SS14]|nr:hypothetical protein M422DRAFT_774019 [Sphaerobolus stellatus SS14]